MFILRQNETFEMSFFAPKSLRGKNRQYFNPLVVERVEEVPFPHPTIRGEAKFSAATSQEWKQIMLMTSRLQHSQKLKEEKKKHSLVFYHLTS